MLFVKSFGVWIVFVIAAIINGATREYFITPKIGSYPGHVVSSVILSCIVFVISFFFIKSLPVLPNRLLLQIGIFWVVLSIAFEFLFGHYVMKQLWSVILADYNIFKGRLILLVWFSALLSPLLSGILLSNR